MERRKSLSERKRWRSSTDKFCIEKHLSKVWGHCQRRGAKKKPKKTRNTKAATENSALLNSVMG